jgi:hypothetical protein
MMVDIPGNSQGASQESSLADTKVLKCSSRVLSGGETSRSGFGFSKAFTYIARLGDTKSCTVYLAKTLEGYFAIKARPGKLTRSAFVASSAATALVHHH